jgi:acyl-CoA synthetase (AMP-forming)/AMP-acid ligase II
MAWLDEPLATRGVRFAQEGEEWDVWPYERLAAAAHSVAGQLVDAGAERGEVIAIVVPTGPGFIAAFFGALLAGGTPAPLVPPSVLESEQRYVERTTDLLAAGPTLVVSESSLLDVVAKAARQGGMERPPVVISLDEGSAEEVRRPLAEHALLQFTSGSSGRPRAVQVTYDNLETDVALIEGKIDWQPDEWGAHWLPLYHDMGLIGCTLTSVMHQRDAAMMRPEQFVIEPLRWLECFGRHGAVITAGPNFTFSYLEKKISPEQLEGMDFSGWRSAIIGAERLDPEALSRFTRMLAPYGFRPEVFMPAYGLAEATLAVTVVEDDRVGRAIAPDWTTMSFGSPVEVLNSALLGEIEDGDGGGWLVGCGEALPGVEVTILDEDGSPLPPGHLGEIRVRGEIVASGYLGAATSITSFDEDGVTTGDAGFFHEDELYVVGRLGDAIKLRGRTLYAEDLESKLAAIPEVPVGRCVVLPGAEGERSVVAIVERPAGPWVERVAKVLQGEAGREARIRVFGAERGTIMRTSSGKPRRQVMWRALLERTLSLTELHDSQVPTEPKAAAQP